MAPYKVNGNLNRPQVNFNSETGILVLDGRSILENSLRFFEPIIDWLDEYAKQPAPNTTLKMQMEYFNSSSSKFLLSICEKLETLHKGGNKVNIEWFYSDEDMAELGEDYANMLKIPFKLIEHQA